MKIEFQYIVKQLKTKKRKIYSDEGEEGWGVMEIEKKQSKKDLSWREKLNYIWCVLRYSKHMANWVAMDCEFCHHYELERIGKPIKSDIGGQKEFQQKYRCLHCGAIGIVTQIWVKDN